MAPSGDTFGLNYQGGDGDSWGPSYRRPPTAPGFGSADFQTPGAPKVTAPAQPAAPQPYSDFGTSGPSYMYTPPPGGYNSAEPGGITGRTSTPDSGYTVDPVQQDQVARQTYSDLKTAGHDVKWQGDTLMVDGRPYTINTGGGAPNIPTGGPGIGTPDWYDPTNGGGVMGLPPNADLSLAAAPPADGSAPAADGYSGPSYLTTPTSTTDFGGGLLDQQNRQINDTFGAAAPEGYDATKWADTSHLSDKYLAGHVMAAGGSQQDAVDALNARLPAGSTAKWKVKGQDTIEAPDGSIFDTRRDFGGANALQWLQVAGPGGVPIVQGGPAGGGADLSASYASSLPNFDLESIIGKLWGAPSATGLDALIENLQQHPSSLDQHATDTMKAQMKDTLAEQQQFEDQNLKGLGASHGISDSPWLASERIASDRSKNQAIASGNANIDVEAAKQRAADARAAASIGLNYQSMRGTQLMGAVGAELQKAGIKFNYAQLAQQNDEFLRDLGYRLAALEQADRQFAASHGLGSTPAPPA